MPRDLIRLTDRAGHKEWQGYQSRDFRQSATGDRTFRFLSHVCSPSASLP